MPIGQTGGVTTVEQDKDRFDTWPLTWRSGIAALGQTALVEGTMNLIYHLISVLLRQAGRCCAHVAAKRTLTDIDAISLGGLGKACLKAGL